MVKKGKTKIQYRDVIIRALRGRAEVFSLIGQADNALIDYRQAISKSDSGSEMSAKLQTGLAFIYMLGKSEYKTSEQIIIGVLKSYGIKRSSAVKARCYSILGKIHNRTGDYKKAIKCLKKAQSIFRSISDEVGYADALLDFGAVYLKYGNMKRALEYYNRALLLCDKTGDKKRSALAQGSIGVVHRRLGRLDIALDFHIHHLTTVETIGDKIGVSIAANNIGNVYFNKGDYDRALQYYERSARISEQVGDRDGASIVLNNIGIVQIRKGNFVQARESLQQSRQICMRIKSKRGIALALGNIANTYEYTGDIKTAYKYHQRSLALCRAIGDDIGIAITVNSIGVIKILQGQFTSALKWFAQGLSIAKHLDDAAIITSSYLGMGTTYLEKQNYRLARRYLKISEEMCRNDNDVLKLPLVYSSLTRLSIRFGDHSTALGYAKKCMDNVEKVFSVNRKILALRTLGIAFQHTDSSRADALFVESATLAKQHGMKIEFAISEFELARSLFNKGEKIRALKIIEQIIVLFKKAGARQWLRRIDRLQEEK